MNRPIRCVGTQQFALALFAIGSAGCTAATNVATNDVIDAPVVEHAIYVTLPGRGLADKPLREQYRKSGRRAIGHIRERCVTRPAPGSPCPETVDVHITAVEGAKYIDPEKAPSNPQLLAWVENLGGKRTYDGFEPSTQFVYALVVAAAPVGDQERAPIIYRVGFSTDHDRSRITQDVYGHVYPCHNYYNRPLFSEADFQACNAHNPYANQAERLPLSALVTALSTWSLLQGTGDPTWFSCNSGCCTSTATELAAMF